MIHTDPTLRFSDRVENYIRYRPGYPPQGLDTLRNECGLTASSVIADIARGTGIFSRLLLENRHPLTGRQPNRQMREAGAPPPPSLPGLPSVEGTAEFTS